MKVGEIWTPKNNKYFPRLILLEYRSNDIWSVKLADGIDISPYRIISGKKLYENYYKVISK